MSEDKLNSGHYFELLDRTHVAENFLTMSIGEHPVLAEHPDLAEIYDRAVEALAELYQKVGQIEKTWE